MFLPPALHTAQTVSRPPAGMHEAARELGAARAEASQARVDCQLLRERLVGCEGERRDLVRIQRELEQQLEDATAPHRWALQWMISGLPVCATGLHA